jgi:hypothetical protein
VRLTQGCFSFLPDLSDAQIEKQVTYAIRQGWAMNINGQMIHIHVTLTGSYGVYLYSTLKIPVLHKAD